MSLKSILLWTIFLGGVVVLCASFKLVQHPDLNQLTVKFNDGPPTDRQKLYIERYTDLNKWLIGLAYAMLAGIVTKRISDDGFKRPLTMEIGSISLLLSLFAGFLSYESLLIALSSKTLDHIGSPLTAYPIAIQMILLGIGTTLLAFGFLRPESSEAKLTRMRSRRIKPAKTKKKTIALILFAIIVPDLTVALHAQDRPGVLIASGKVPIPAWFDSCVSNWERDREKSAWLSTGLSQGLYQQVMAETALTNATHMNQNAQIDSCPKFEVLLDHLREQASAHTYGNAHLVITGNNEARTLDGKSHQYQSTLEILTAEGKEKITSKISGNELNGTLTYFEGNREHTASVNLTRSDNFWRGTMIPAPPKFGRHAVLSLQISDEQASLSNYLIDYVLASDEGLFWCQRTCPQSKAFFEEGLSAVVSWSVGAFTAQNAYLEIADPKLSGVQVYLDKREVAPIPFTFSLKPGKSYSVTLQRGLNVIYTDSVTLTPNENRQWRAPAEVR